MGLRPEFLAHNETLNWVRDKQNHSHPFYLGLRKQCDLQKPPTVTNKNKKEKDKLGEQTYTNKMQEICSKRAWNYLLRRAQKRTPALSSINFKNDMELANQLLAFFKAYKGDDKKIQSLFRSFIFFILTKKTQKLTLQDQSNFQKQYHLLFLALHHYKTYEFFEVLLQKVCF